jgi:hypothetical protein
VFQFFCSILNVVGGFMSLARACNEIVDSCSEWTQEKLFAYSKSNERLWSRDADQLLSAPNMEQTELRGSLSDY